MINLTHEEAQQVLDALEDVFETENWVSYTDAKKLLRAKLSEPDDVPKWIYQEAVTEGAETHHWAVVMHDMDKTVEGWSEDVKMYYDGKLIAPQPEPEPVAWTVGGLITDFSRDFSAYKTKTYTQPLYTTPPQRKPEPEPVAWMDAPERIYLQVCDDENCDLSFEAHDDVLWCQDKINDCDILYVRSDTAPPQHKWQGLTDEEMAAAWSQSKGDVLYRLKPFARAIEAKLRERNST